MDMLDRLVRSCFGSFWGFGKEDAGDSKYIDYAPTRKWRYNDHNLMKELSSTSASDVAQLSDDRHGQTSTNIKLRLHDNVFLNPLNDEKPCTNDTGINRKEIIGEITPHIAQIVVVENNNNYSSLDEIANEPVCSLEDNYESNNVVCSQDIYEQDANVNGNEKETLSIEDRDNCHEDVYRNETEESAQLSTQCCDSEDTGYERTDKISIDNKDQSDHVKENIHNSVQIEDSKFESIDDSDNNENELVSNDNVEESYTEEGPSSEQEVSKYELEFTADKENMNRIMNIMNG